MLPEKKYEKYKYYVERENLDKYIALDPNNSTALLVYAFIGDDRGFSYHSTGYHETMPVYKKNEKLDCLYDFLCDIGYECSEEERALRDGTHELYKY